MADQGYPDFQRVVNWDSGLILDQPATSLISHAVGPFFVGRWSYLSFYLEVTVAPATVQVDWYADQALTKIIGSRRLAIDVASNEPATFRIPNMGPWATIDFSSASGAATTILARMFGTNRAQLLEAFPRRPLYAANIGVLIGAGATDRAPCYGLYSGPASVLLAAGTVPLNFELQVFQLDGTYAHMFATTLAAGAQLNTQLDVPLGSMRTVVINNSGGNGSYDFTISPSTSGA